MAKAKEKKPENSKQEVTKKAPKAKKESTKESLDHSAVSSDEAASTTVTNTQDIESPSNTGTAKAGKRSAKAVAETEAKQAKEERKTEKSETETKDLPKVATKPSRSKLERRGKKFREVAKLIETDKSYSINEALDLATKTSPVKFDATVEMHIRLNVDPRQADQNIRDIVALPAGTGKSVRVAVFADVADVAKAKKAGADVTGSDEFLQQLDKGTIDFDVLIATPSQMPKLGKYARLLGPKGLMPNPKSGTVATDITKAVNDARAGRVEYRVDSTGIVHVGVGKVSFGRDKLTENAGAIIASIKGNKPSSIKVALIRSAYVTTTMGPSIQLDLTNL